MDPTRPLTLDATALRIDFVASLGMLRVRGTFRDVTGHLMLAGADGDEAGLVIEIAAASIDTGLPMRDRHLRGASFLDSERHPLVTFRSTWVAGDDGDLMVGGVLLLRGTRRDLLARCPVAPAEGGAPDMVSLSCDVEVPIRAHGVGVPRGIDLLNPIFLAVGHRVQVRVRTLLPMTAIPGSLLPARAR